MPLDTRETPDGTVHISYVDAKYFDTQAVSPTKSKEYNGRWDLTLIARTDGRESDVQGAFNGFRTGIAFVPPRGWTLRLHDAPTLKSMGYSLMGPVDVPTYEDRTELVVQLYKLDDNQEIELPFVALTAELVRNVIFHIPEDVRQNAGHSVGRKVAKSKATRVVKLLDEEEDQPRLRTTSKRKITSY